MTDMLTSYSVENEKIQCENEAMLEALKNVTCPACGGPPLGVERDHNLQNLSLVNTYLTEKVTTSNYITSIHFCYYLFHHHHHHIFI